MTNTSVSPIEQLLNSLRVIARQTVGVALDKNEQPCGDGWRAAVEVKRITAAERKKIDKSTKGFCGYEWMIDSILKWGDIYAEPPIKQQA